VISLRGRLGLAPDLHHAAPLQPLSTRPWVGILGVLFGAFISTLTGRLSSFGLLDIRGAVHAGVDEGAWITTSFAVAQMVIGPPSVWLAAALGARRVLLFTCVAYAGCTVMVGLAGDLPSLLFWLAASGLASGCFIPLTIGFVLQNLAPKYWPFGIAAYALNLELSLNISATLEGWWIEHVSWHWIFWQTAPAALLMAACVWFGVPRVPVNTELLKRGDWFGMAALSIGCGLMFAGLDQGNRLDWLGSGLVVGLLAGGGLLVAAFLLHERLAPSPWINLGYVVTGNMPIAFSMVAVLRFALLSTSFVIPQYLGAIQGFRSLDTGRVLMWIAVPQLVAAPLVGVLLRFLDARLVMTVGFGAIALACWLVAGGLTPDWATGDFLPSQLIQALGQTFAMSAVIFFGAQHLKPADALTFGVVIQTFRLFGGEIGVAVISTFTRVREQAASALIGLHVQAGDSMVADRLAAYAGAVASRAQGPAEASARATALLANAVRAQANLQSYIDGFMFIALVIFGCFLLILLLRPAPEGPAAPVRLFRRRLPGGPPSG
jgi:DHA2 family multidrug resistance protein